MIKCITYMCWQFIPRDQIIFAVGYYLPIWNCQIIYHTTSREVSDSTSSKDHKLLFQLTQRCEIDRLLKVKQILCTIYFLANDSLFVLPPNWLNEYYTITTMYMINIPAITKNHQYANSEFGISSYCQIYQNGTHSFCEVTSTYLKIRHL